MGILVHKGLLRPINIGRAVRFVQSEVEEHLKSQVAK
jgi:predicted DNA-binding transcriptional regulator AlpA